MGWIAKPMLDRYPHDYGLSTKAPALTACDVFVANCEHAQAVGDPKIGKDAIRNLVSKEFPEGWLAAETQNLQNDKSRRKCFMQLLCGEAMKHGSCDHLDKLRNEMIAGDRMCGDAEMQTCRNAEMQKC